MRTNLVGVSLPLILTVRPGDFLSRPGCLQPTLAACSSSLERRHALCGCFFHPDYNQRHLQVIWTLDRSVVLKLQHNLSINPAYKPGQTPEMSFAEECEWNKMPCQVRAELVDTAPVGALECHSSKYQAPTGTKYFDILAWTLLLHKHALCNTCLFVSLSLCSSSRWNFQPRHNLFAL